MKYRVTDVPSQNLIIFANDIGLINCYKWFSMIRTYFVFSLFLYDKELRHERVKIAYSKRLNIKKFKKEEIWFQLKRN